MVFDKLLGEIANLTCPYCGHTAYLADSKVIYGKSYGWVYLCQNFPECDAYVGTHRGTTKPLGRLADKELREWKQKAHNEIDPLWKSKLKTRNNVYRLVAQLMKCHKDEAHIGMFSVEQCQELVYKIQKWKKKKKIKV